MLINEYYVIERENNDDYPLFLWDQLSNDFGIGKPVEAKEPVKMRLGEPLSANFEWVDFHTSPAPFVSNKIANALSNLTIYGIQFLPAQVKNPKNESEIKDYWFMHVWNQIECMDKDSSEFTMSKSGLVMFEIDKLVFDDKILNKTQLAKRLIFTLSEDPSVLIMHQSIKDVIERVNPKGCRFFKTSEWNSDIIFD